MAKQCFGCEAKIDELTERYGTDELTIAPIGNFRVIRDLVVDWEAKVDRLKTVAPWIFLKAEFNEGDKIVRQTPADFKKIRCWYRMYPLWLLRI